MLTREPYHRTRRRLGKNTQRVTIAVSSEMAKLRGLQTDLNYFLYSTELSYGLALTGSDPRLKDNEMSVSDALADVYSSAWYPSNQGRKKYTPKISSFLDQLGRNLRHVSRAVIIQWYSYFEEYLKMRVGPSSRESWGPLTQSLRSERLLNATFPIQISTVLRADFCRKIRNLIAHGQLVPDSDQDREVVSWHESAVATLKKKVDPWSVAAPEKSVHLALDYVLREAINHKRAAEREGRRENIEHFYTLFSLTNLDSLAIEIEEALQRPGTLPEGRIGRKRDAVRRADLIVPDSRDGETL